MQLTFSYHNAFVSGAVIDAGFQTLLPEIDRLCEALTTGYDSAYASINVLEDRDLQDAVQRLAQEKRSLKPTALVLIGIGGSNMGFKAVHEALHGTLHNERMNVCKVYYADTVDTDYTCVVLRLVEQELQSGHTVLCVVVSKSGTTIETIANAQLFLSLLKRYNNDRWTESVVAITDHDSALWREAQRQNIACLAIPASVGGRFSVFSPVGLFPLAMLGVDVEQLVAGARSIVPLCTSRQLSENSAAVSAIIRAQHYKAGVNINDLFIFDGACASVGAWYRQLMGESIGKEYNRNGERVEMGITPTVSIGSIDLHSVAQLYLGGPRDTLSMFLSVEQVSDRCRIGPELILQGCADSVTNHSFSSVMSAIMRGTQAAYAKDRRPFTTMILPSKSPFAIGQLLQWYMFEIIYLGFLCRVNPFDQPNVQAYKKETERILASEW